MPALSVIICTHNPRPDYLRRTLDALKTQTLPKEQWELLVIDNASKEPLGKSWDISWHPQARHIREEELGLTPARLRGIKESQGGLLVFVDDDNILAGDYLKVALELRLSHPWVGAFGGNIIGEYETKPESCFETMLECLAVVEVKEQSWGCGPGSKGLAFAPCGAGMVILRTIAAYYAELVANDSLRRSLDRKGTLLSSCGDSDMALCACALGLAVGRFPQLQLAHLIPAARLERNYLLRLFESMTLSLAILRYIWDRNLPREKKVAPSRSEKLFRSYQALRNRLRGTKPSFEDEKRSASERGIVKAIQILQSEQKYLPGCCDHD